MKKRFLILIAIFLFCVGSAKAQVVWGVRAGGNSLVFTRYNLSGKPNIEIGPILNYPLKYNFYLNTAIMFGIKSFVHNEDTDNSRYESNKLFLFIPSYIGYYFLLSKRTSFFFQAGPFLENWDSSQCAGVATMTGINIQRINIEIGYRAAVESNYFLLKQNTLFMGVSYIF